MEVIGVNSAEYKNILINTIFVNMSNKPHPHSLFLQELAKCCDESGKCFRFDAEPIIKNKLKVNKNTFQKTLDRLRHRGHLIVKGWTIYLHPNYTNAIKCDPANGGDGLFIISTLKPIK